MPADTTIDSSDTHLRLCHERIGWDRPASGPVWWALVVSASQAGRAELVVFLHDLLKFVSRAADHLVLIVVVLERATCGPVQDSLIKLTELRFWDIDVLGGPVRVALYMPVAEDPLGEGFDVQSRNHRSPSTACRKQVSARLPRRIPRRRRSAHSSFAPNCTSSLGTSSVAR